MIVSPEERFFYTGGIAAQLSVTRNAVFIWIQTGLIVSNRTPGRHHRIHCKDLLIFVKSWIRDKVTSTCDTFRPDFVIVDSFKNTNRNTVFADNLYSDERISYAMVIFFCEPEYMPDTDNQESMKCFAGSMTVDSLHDNICELFDKKELMH